MFKRLKATPLTILKLPHSIVNQHYYKISLEEEVKDTINTLCTLFKHCLENVMLMNSICSYFYAFIYIFMRKNNKVTLGTRDFLSFRTLKRSRRSPSV